MSGKGSKRRPGKPGVYEDGWERVFGKPAKRSQWLADAVDKVVQDHGTIGDVTPYLKKSRNRT